MTLAYQPAWFGTPLWDDDHHLTAPALRSLDGLGRIWTEVGATLQYYPLLHTAFWLQAQLWGDAMVGYHLVNLALHGSAAVLVFLLLRRLAVSGAGLAAALFALHPVQVESVAWITELKNTLSTVCYLAAALAYWRFHESRRVSAYACAGAWFVAALLSKTVTGTLPFAVLVVIWWKAGRLQWRTDVRPLVPFIVVGVAMGLFTAWWEIVFNRTGTAAFALTPVERALLGGRAIVFQLTSLVWPMRLLFSYPRWALDAGAWWQYTFPLAVGLALGVAWAARQRTRGPLAALLFFIVSLGPTLGAFNLYTFRYSFVADHYQYVACLGIFALVSAAVTPWLTTRPPATRMIGWTLCGLVLGGLALQTWRLSHHYRSAEASYEAILRGDPDNWFAHANLGAGWIHRDPTKARAHLDAALRLNPELAEAHGNLCLLLVKQDRLPEAVPACRRALGLNPRLPGPHHTLADALRELGRPREALHHYEMALTFRPNDPRLHESLGQLLVRMGPVESGLRHLRTAIELQPASAEARSALGFAFADLGLLEQAEAEHRRAIEINPASVSAHYGLANVHLAAGRVDAAASTYAQAVALDATMPGIFSNYGVALDRAGRTQDAERAFRRALELQPAFQDAEVNLAGLLVRTNRAAQAVQHFEGLLEREPAAADIRLGLAAARLQLGDRAGAIRELEVILEQAPDHPEATRELRRLRKRPPG